MHEPTSVRPLNGGTQRLYEFPNGFGASVVRHDHSYGHETGLWELAVLDSKGHLTYDTPITSDVLGHLTMDSVMETLDRIAALDPKEVAATVAERALRGEWKAAVEFDETTLGFDDWKAAR